jgi:hypothetical protein
VTIQQIIAALRNPQAAISVLSALVTAFGTVGILAAPLTGALQAVLAAVLALAVALAHVKATLALVRRAGRKATPPTTLAA